MTTKYNNIFLFDDVWSKLFDFFSNKMYLEEKKILGQSLEECVVERRLGNTEKNLVFDKIKLLKKND